MDRAAVIEQLADIEHQRWADWQRWVHECGTKAYVPRVGLEGILALPNDRVAAWERQIATPYADLSEREKASDREQVMRYWPLIVDFVETWIRENASHMSASEAAALWREEMQEASQP